MIQQLEKLNQDEFFRAAIQQADDETTVYKDGKTAAAKKNNCWKGVTGVDRNVHQKTTPISRFGKKHITRSGVHDQKRTEIVLEGN